MKLSEFGEKDSDSQHCQNFYKIYQTGKTRFWQCLCCCQNFPENGSPDFFAYPYILCVFLISFLSHLTYVILFSPPPALSFQYMCDFLPIFPDIKGHTDRLWSRLVGRQNSSNQSHCKSQRVTQNIQNWKESSPCNDLCDENYGVCQDKENRCQPPSSHTCRLILHENRLFFDAWQDPCCNFEQFLRIGPERQLTLPLWISTKKPFKCQSTVSLDTIPILVILAPKIIWSWQITVHFQIWII